MLCVWRQPKVDQEILSVKLSLGIDPREIVVVLWKGSLLKDALV